MGPGKTTLLQCDLSAMVGPDMFAETIPPGIDAIEWTPEPGRPWGGDPEWYELYRSIKNAGKSVQAIFVKPDEAEPLLEAIGPEGIFLDIRCSSETEAIALLDRLQKWYG